MLERLNHWIVAGMDLLLGWLLRLPSDVQLIAVALGSAIILSAVRVWTSNQDLLRRCRDDKTRLKTLIREAKKRGDRAAVQRHRSTLGMIAMKQLRQEGRPLLASLLPIVLLATWAFNRLEFHPPSANEPVEFTAYFPISAAGRITHIAPTSGVLSETGWLQEIIAVAGQGPAHALATWRLTASARPEPHRLQVRFDHRTFEHPLRVGARTYEPPVRTHDGVPVTTEAKLRPVKLFGIVPGIPAILFPPWLTAYLLLVIPCVFVLKRVFRIY
jgi:uncharacterized membrane protein (DUF106 family)